MLLSDCGSFLEAPVQTRRHQTLKSKVYKNSTILVPQARLMAGVNMKHAQWPSTVGIFKPCVLFHIYYKISPKRGENKLERIICMKSVIQSDESLTFGEETKQLRWQWGSLGNQQKHRASMPALWLVIVQNMKRGKKNELKMEWGIKKRPCNCFLLWQFCWLVCCALCLEI